MSEKSRTPSWSILSWEKADTEIGTLDMTWLERVAVITTSLMTVVRSSFGAASWALAASPVRDEPKAVQAMSAREVQRDLAMEELLNSVL